MQPGPPRRRPARPVADAPIDELLARSEDLTKGWLLALLEEAPLGDAPAILAADMARDGPRVCDAIVRALAADADLRRLGSGGPLERLVSQTGELAGATDIESTIRAVGALGAVVWSAVRGELRDADPDQISELAERLALVIELVRAAALRRFAGSTAGGPALAPPVSATAPATPAGVATPETSGSPAAGAVASAERAGASEPGARGVATAEPKQSHPDALWVGALDDEIAHSGRSGAPLSLLLAELEEADRVVAVEPDAEASATFGRFAQAVRGAVRRQDILACETEARAWIIARDTGRAGAQALGSRIASAVRAVEPWRGAPMVVSVGVSVLGEDGRDSPGLIDAAEVARFAAAADGIQIVHAAPPSEGDEEPGRPGPRIVS